METPELVSMIRDDRLYDEPCFRFKMSLTRRDEPGGLLLFRYYDIVRVEVVDNGVEVTMEPNFDTPLVRRKEK